MSIAARALASQAAFRGFDVHVSDSDHGVAHNAAQSALPADGDHDSAHWRGSLITLAVDYQHIRLSAGRTSTDSAVPTTLMPESIGRIRSCIDTRLPDTSARTAG